jgi:hypothetical protein
MARPTGPSRPAVPPLSSVDGILLDPPWWAVDPTLPSDIAGLRMSWDSSASVRIGRYARVAPCMTISSQSSGIHRRLKLRKAPLPEHAARSGIQFWWPLSFSFGPSKAGERASISGFAYETKMTGFIVQTQIRAGAGSRDSLAVAYYWDSWVPNGRARKRLDG